MTAKTNDMKLLFRIKKLQTEVKTVIHVVDTLIRIKDKKVSNKFYSYGKYYA